MAQVKYKSHPDRIVNISCQKIKYHPGNDKLIRATIPVKVWYLKDANKIWCNSKARFYHEHNFVENTDFIWISQGFFEDNIYGFDTDYFNLKIKVSIVANAFGGLHDD